MVMMDCIRINVFTLSATCTSLTYVLPCVVEVFRVHRKQGVVYGPGFMSSTLGDNVAGVVVRR